MAYESPLWLFIYRTPADDYRFRHLLQVNGCVSPAHAKESFFRHTNIDAKIERGGPIKDVNVTADHLAKLLKEEGPEFRALREHEQRLTLADMAKLKAGGGLDFIGLDDQPVAVPLSIQELQKRAAELSTPQ